MNPFWSISYCYTSFLKYLPPLALGTWLFSRFSIISVIVPSESPSLPFVVLLTSKWRCYLKLYKPTPCFSLDDLIHFFGFMPYNRCIVNWYHLISLAFQTPVCPQGNWISLLHGNLKLKMSQMDILVFPPFKPVPFRAFSLILNYLIILLAQPWVHL